jgi:hypothetical protein
MVCRAGAEVTPEVLAKQHLDIRLVVDDETSSNLLRCMSPELARRDLIRT